MSKKNDLSIAQPYAVEHAIKMLGQNLRTARLRRGFTMAEVAERIGVGVRAVRDAENGKATSSIAVYTALLWLYDMQEAIARAADPASDKEGQLLYERKFPKRAYGRTDMDNDF